MLFKNIRFDCFAIYNFGKFKTVTDHNENNHYLVPISRPVLRKFNIYFIYLH